MRKHEFEQLAAAANLRVEESDLTKTYWRGDDFVVIYTSGEILRNDPSELPRRVRSIVAAARYLRLT